MITKNDRLAQLAKTRILREEDEKAFEDLTEAWKERKVALDAAIVRDLVLLGEAYIVFWEYEEIAGPLAFSAFETLEEAKAFTRSGEVRAVLIQGIEGPGVSLSHGKLFNVPDIQGTDIVMVGVDQVEVGDQMFHWIPDYEGNLFRYGPYEVYDIEKTGSSWILYNLDGKILYDSSVQKNHIGVVRKVDSQ